jgi:hypothetical protein
VYSSGDQIKKNEMGDMWHVWGTGEVHTGFWWGDLVERGHLDEIDGWVILK